MVTWVYEEAIQVCNEKGDVVWETDYDIYGCLNPKQVMDNMKVFFSQIYIQVGVNFNFSHQFQKFLSGKVSELLYASEKFLKLHDKNFTIIFRISAKKELATNEIKGATIYKKDKDIEFTVFLPYTPIMQEPNPNKSALEHLFQGIYEVLGKYEIDTSKLKTEQGKIIDKIMSSPEMFGE